MNTAIIIGATFGIGREIAFRLVAEGWRVGIAGRRAEALEQTRYYFKTAFYDRQFITREEINHSVVRKFSSLLDSYLAETAENEGLPTVAYFADKCCYSTKYFGELVKTETGRTARDFINDRILSSAKKLLADGSISISPHISWWKTAARGLSPTNGWNPSATKSTALCKIPDYSIYMQKCYNLTRKSLSEGILEIRL